MKKCIVGFIKCIQDSQDLGGDEEHMVSRVFFDLQIDGHVHSGLYCDIKQVVGSNYETGDIEVGPPVGYKGPFNYTAFRDAVERYYRSLVGSTGSAFRVSGSVRMRNNRIVIGGAAEFEIDDSPPGAW